MSRRSTPDVLEVENEVTSADVTNDKIKISHIGLHDSTS